MEIYIDLKDSRIVKISGFFSIRGNETNLSSEFADLKRVGGMEFPFKVTKYVGGQEVAETLIEDTK
jgi:hypothetical protein